MRYRKSVKIITIIIIVLFLFATFAGGIIPFLMPNEEKKEVESTFDVGDVDISVKPAEIETDTGVETTP